MDGEIGRAAQTKRGDCLHVCERPSVIETPVANRAMLERALHASVFGEFNSGLLDFAVRKQPNDRFIMKIDDLDASGPYGPVHTKRQWLQRIVYHTKMHRRDLEQLLS